jgi:hypothetical protein
MEEEAKGLESSSTRKDKARKQQKRNQESIEAESRSNQGNDTNWGKCNGKGLILTIVVV